jgi:alanine racemase
MANNHFTVLEIAALTGAQRVSGRSDNAVLTSLLTDSRHLSLTGGCLFVALATARNDGHRYIAELYEKGLRHFLVQYVPKELQAQKDIDFLVVGNTLDALQQLAAEHRGRFTMPVVGITGSNGKTVVKEWLSYLLMDDKKIVKSPKSYNSQIGVPLSVWEMTPENDMAIFEAGLSQPGEMERHRQVIRPTIGIFTNIGAAHDEYFSDRHQKIQEKLKLFAGAEQLVYCNDHEDIHQLVQHSKTALKGITLFAWGTAEGARLKVTGIDPHKGHTTIKAKYQGQDIQICIPFPDKASIENALHCWAFMLLLGYEPTVIAARMQTLPAIEMRMELKEAINNCSVINDSYSSDYSSLQIAVDFLAQQQQHARKTVILSDILQSGRDDKALYAAVAQLLVAKKVDHLIGIGPALSKHAECFSLEKDFYPDTDTFLREHPFAGFRDETILLKGARTFAFEKIDKALQQKAHETVLEINLNALAHNLNYFRAKLAPGVRMMVMVKAFSYGSGSFEIANLLQFHQVDYLAVAYADEGVELRRAGIRLPIMVMNPEEKSFDAMLAHHLEPEIYSFRILNLLKERLSQQPQPTTIHIKLDTGMHRLGFEETDLPQLIEALKQLQGVQGIRVASVFSHLAASDNPALDRFTHRQIATFRRMSGQVKAVCTGPVYGHILNSAGISRFPDAQFDMTRLGIGLYGVGVDPEESQQLQHVSTLKTIISQIKHIPAGSTVGYNRNYLVSKEATIGILPVGYADGLNRRFGNGRGKVFVGGTAVPVVGNVCMDMCMIDLTGVKAQENDEVIIFGEEQPVSEVARVLETIPYEILTGISRRVKRIYYQE